MGHIVVSCRRLVIDGSPRDFALTATRLGRWNSPWWAQWLSVKYTKLMLKKYWYFAIKGQGEVYLTFLKMSMLFSASVWFFHLKYRLSDLFLLCIFWFMWSSYCMVLVVGGPSSVILKMIQFLPIFQRDTDSQIVALAQYRCHKVIVVVMILFA